jgi:hypothetical protein
MLIPRAELRGACWQRRSIDDVAALNRLVERFTVFDLKRKRAEGDE